MRKAILMIAGTLCSALVSAPMIASAQQSGGTVRSEAIRDALKPSIRPRIAVPDKTDIDAQVRAAGSPVTREQRLVFARAMAERELTGIGAPTHLELKKGRLEVPLKLKGLINGPVSWRPGESLRIWNHRVQTGDLTERGTIETRVVATGAFGLELLRPRTNPPTYYLVEVYYEGAVDAKANLLYARDGRVKEEEAGLNYSEGGVISFLVDAEKTGSINNSRRYRLNYRSSNPLIQISVPERSMSIKTISVSPVR